MFELYVLDELFHHTIYTEDQADDLFHDYCAAYPDSRIELWDHTEYGMILVCDYN